MKPLFAVGLVILILGVASVFVPIPKKERSGVQVGGVSLGVETTHRDTVAPIVSGVLILAGAVLMIVGRGRSR
jgi:hypothetical protein